MTPESIATIARVIFADPPTSKAQVEVLKGVLGAYDRVQPMLVKRVDAAKMLGVTPECLDKWTREGLIAKRCIAGRVKTGGFLLADIEKLIKGDAQV